MQPDFEEDVLRALRRITRAIDLHSRHLATTYGLTGPQLVCLRVIADRDCISPSKLALEVSLSQGTITGITDRLATRQLITRERSDKDRRAVTVKITQAGRQLIAAAPSPLQERFADRLASLSDEERAMIRLSLNKIVQMMDGTEIDAAPVLSTEPQLDSTTDLSTAGQPRTAAYAAPPATKPRAATKKAAAKKAAAKKAAAKKAAAKKAAAKKAAAKKAAAKNTSTKKAAAKKAAAKRAKRSARALRG